MVPAAAAGASTPTEWWRGRRTLVGFRPRAARRAPRRRRVRARLPPPGARDRRALREAMRGPAGQLPLTRRGHPGRGRPPDEGARPGEDGSYRMRNGDAAAGSGHRPVAHAACRLGTAHRVCRAADVRDTPVGRAGVAVVTAHRRAADARVARARRAGRARVAPAVEVAVAATGHSCVAAADRWITGVARARIAVVAGHRCVDASLAGIAGVGGTGIPVVAVDRHAAPARSANAPGALHAGVAPTGCVARAAARDRRVSAAGRVVATVGGARIAIVAVDRGVRTAVGSALVDGAGVAVVAVERHARQAQVVVAEREARFLAVARIPVVARVGMLASERLATGVGGAGEVVVAIDWHVYAAVVRGTRRGDAAAEARHAVGRDRALAAVGRGE